MQRSFSKLATLAATLALAACAGNPGLPDGGPVNANGLNPVGTLQGLIADAYDRKPLGGAKVTINFEQSSRTATTAADGTFSFFHIPASANPGGLAPASGTYSVVLDLTGVAAAGRSYKPFYNTTIAVQFTALGDKGTGADAGGTPSLVDGLVSNVTFVVHQARATISGKVYLGPALTPLSTDLLLIAGTGASIPAGSVAAASTTGSDGTFSFTGIEEGLTYSIIPADQSLVLDPTGNNYNGGTIYAFELGVNTRTKPLVLLPKPASDAQTPYVVSTDPLEDEVLARADASENILLTFNEAMDTSRGPERAVATFKRVGRRGTTTDTESVDVPFTATWNEFATVLTVDPVNALLPGYRYRLTVANAQLLDLGGNARTGTIPGTSPAEKDALAVAGLNDDLHFSVGASAADLTLAGLTQEPDTADNRVANTPVRAIALEQADPGDQSFFTRQRAGFYASSNTDSAYLTWNPPADPVAGFVVYTRSSASGVPIRVTTNALGAFQTAYSTTLATLDTLLNADPNGNPGVGLPNNLWDDAMAVDLGVSAVNADGREGPIAFITLRDDTGPAFPITGLGLDRIFVGGVNDTVSVTDQQSCKTIPLATTNVRTHCPSVAAPLFGGMTAKNFGERVMVFDLTESVDAASVIPANLSLVSGTLPTNLGAIDPNTNGSATEPEATIADAKAFNALNGRATRIAVLFGNWFGIDSGDKLLLRASSTAAVKDLAGNLARDTNFITAPLVDAVTPMIKSVALDTANERMTVTFTKWVVPGDFATLLQFQNFATAKAGLLSAVHSINSNGEAQVVLQFVDLGWLRGYNSTEASGFTNANVGTRVKLNGLRNADYDAIAGTPSAATNTTDVGTEAYANVPADPADTANSPGAYLPGSNGVGTRASFRDTIGPRLSSAFGERSFATGSNAATVTTTGAISVPVWLTENTLGQGASPAGTGSAVRLQNWTVKIVDLGTDGWTGNSGTDAAAGGATASVTAVTVNSNNAINGPQLTLTVTVNATVAGTFGVGTLTMGTSVQDNAGNSTSGHNVWTYNPGRVNPQLGTVDPGWDRN